MYKIISLPEKLIPLSLHRTPLILDNFSSEVCLSKSNRDTQSLLRLVLALYAFLHPITFNCFHI